IGECRRLLSEQAGRDYYSPSWEEVDELWRENCLTGGDAWKALEEWLRTSEGMGEKLCGDVTCELWNRLAGGTPFDEAALWLAEQLSFMEDEKIQTMMKLLREAAGETRMLFNRGFCWNEIGDKEDASSLACQVLIMPGSSDAVRRAERLEKSLRDKGFLPDYGIRAEYLKDLGRAVYPADPCPCGSGRSYIRCCGRDWTEKHRL
ncbi:MAG: SEC-C domain-containing protein, partial [Lachnospiraceae bacterium]|nr:SEC-C domain-containing protein [Lachnospiraceae bacterium]